MQRVEKLAKSLGYELKELQVKGRNGEEWVLVGPRATILIMDVEEAESYLTVLQEKRRKR